ncbi:stabilizer of axonemal microtubules 2 [Chaetodon trifascialis]|uniref:stabilizer of axonemal microtubules 2 n=1 Tax=Chaetodon trifascialis TaxID=109706 RepID=UPI00399608F6
MRPETVRLQNAPHDGNQPATPMRRHTQTWSMITEYQDRFPPPHCNTAGISASAQKGPDHPLKAARTNMTTFKSCYVTPKWIKDPPKAPQPSALPRVHQRCSSASRNPLHFVENQTASEVKDYTTMYKNDFQAWKTKKRQPYKLHDNLKVSQGLVVPISANKGHALKSSVQVAANSKALAQEQEPQPFESITSYRSDYVTHPMQPQTCREKRVYRPGKVLPSEPAASLKPKVTGDINQEVFDKASEFFKQFQPWSLETKLPDQGKAKKSSPPADPNKFLSATQANYTAHKCQRTEPILPSMQTSEESKKPFQATTTMREDYKAWDSQRHFTAVLKEVDKSKKTTFSVCTHNPAHRWKTNPKPSNLHPKLNETAVSNAKEKPQRPAEDATFSTFESISNGNEDFRRYWATCLDAGVTWPNGDICGPTTNQLHGF